MASKKQKLGNKFPEDLMRNWEKTDGVNFAIALSRITGWLLHVDWWATHEKEAIENMIPLRVYVGTDTDDIFDFIGKKRLSAYSKYITTPLAEKRAKEKRGIVLTRFYGEVDLLKLPLKVKPNELEIKKAHEAILKNSSFLSKIPLRLNHIPAHIAAQYMFGWCSVFAEVIREIHGLPAVAIMVTKYSDMASLTKTGFCHSVNLHPDGEVEDAFGKQPLSNILSKFGIVDYTLSEEFQATNNRTLKENSPDKYREAYEQAKSLLR